MESFSKIVKFQLSGWESRKNTTLSTAETLNIRILGRETCVENDPSIAKQATGNIRCFQYSQSKC